MARTAKKVTSRKTAKARPGGKKGRSWDWKFRNTYVADQKKWTKEARLTLPAPKDTVRGCIFAAVVAVKKGTDKDIEEAAIRLGLEKLTKQSTRKQVQMKLRRFARHGVLIREKHTKKMARKEKRAQRAAVPPTRAKATPSKAKPAPAPVSAPRASARPPAPVARPATRPRKAPAKAPAPAVPPAPAAPNPANPPRPRPRLRAKPKPAPATSPAPAPTPATPAPADSPVATLLAETAACVHQWEEQPGEPARDVCISCGAVRE